MFNDVIMELQPWEIIDPTRLLAELDATTGLPSDTAWVVQVEDPSTRQRIVRIDQLSHGAPEQWSRDDGRTAASLSDELDIDPYPEPWRPACDELRSWIDQWQVPGDAGPPSHLGVVVTIRPGLCVFGPRELDWCLAWRYVNHLKPLFSGGLILVTEHGWAEFGANRGGRSPALAG